MRFDMSFVSWANEGLRVAVEKSADQYLSVNDLTDLRGWLPYAVKESAGGVITIREIFMLQDDVKKSQVRFERTIIQLDPTSRMNFLRFIDGIFTELGEIKTEGKIPEVVEKAISIVQFKRDNLVFLRDGIKNGTLGGCLECREKDIKDCDIVLEALAMIK